MEPSLEVTGAAGDPLAHMLLRAVVIYAAALAIIRLSGDVRMLGKHAAFDVILGVIFGSLMSRGINGSAPFLETIVLGAVLVGIHWILAVLSFHSHGFGKLLKGDPETLAAGGRIDWKPMRKNHITERDLLESTRLKGIPSLQEVALATLERNGEISAIRHAGRVLEVKVEAGVQTIRIEVA